MEKWMIRGCAALCAGGSLALFWAFGVFLAVPWRENRLLALHTAELQLLAVALITALAVGWGALHVLAFSDRLERPRLYAASRLLLCLLAVLAGVAGVAWTTARLG